MISKNRPFVRLTDAVTTLAAGAESIPRFEKVFSELCGTPFALAFPYNRVGIYGALVAHGIKDKEVLVSAYNCVVVASSIICSGNRPVFVDIDPVTYNMNLADAAKKVTPNTAAAVSSFMYGTPMDSGALRSLLPAAALIVEDAALATPGIAYDPPLLSGADVSIFSLDLNKMMTSVNGGMLLFNDAGTYERLRGFRERDLRLPGLVKRMQATMAVLLFWAAFKPPLYGVLDPLRRHSTWLAGRVRAYSIDRPRMDGDWQTRLSPSQAALGLSQLSRLPEIIAARKRIDSTYRECLSDIRDISLPPIAPYPYSHYAIRVKERDAVREQLYRRGIECGRTLDYCLPDMPMFAAYGQQASCPESSRAAAEVLNLPNYPGLTVETARWIAAEVRATLGKSSNAHKRH